VLLAHLRVSMSTTSAWTVLTLSQGQTVLSRVRRESPTNAWSVQTAGFSFNGTGSAKKSLTADLLYLDTGNQPFTLKLTKSAGGTSQVSIKNLTTNSTVGSLSDAGHDAATGATNLVSQTFSKAQVMGSQSAPLPRADPRKLVIADYYPWYTTYHNANIAERPKNPRSAYTAAGVMSMTKQAKANGIDGFAVSWQGASSDAKQFGLAVKAANKEHQYVTGYLESAIATSGQLLTGEQRELQWLVQLLKYRHNKSFLKTPGGTPVVFVYSMNSLTTWQWSDLLGKLHSTYHLKVALIGDDGDAKYLPYEWGLHSYNATASTSALRTYALDTSIALKGQAALNPTATKKLFVTPVSPGYDDQKLRGRKNPIVPRNHGVRYKQVWRAALAGQPDWILVTSWNEWFEDTAVEPGTKTGSKALAITREESAAWKRSGN
jgi:hypothetical protein